MCGLSPCGHRSGVSALRPQVRGEGCERAPDARCKGSSTAPNCLEMTDPGATMTSLTIRMAEPTDSTALERLAQLDSTAAPEQPVLVAEIDGELWSAIS